METGLRYSSDRDRHIRSVAPRRFLGIGSGVKHRITQNGRGNAGLVAPMDPELFYRPQSCIGTAGSLFSDCKLHRYLNGRFCIHDTSDRSSGRRRGRTPTPWFPRLRPDRLRSNATGAFSLSRSTCPSRLPEGHHGTHPSRHDQRRPLPRPAALEELKAKRCPCPDASSERCGTTLGLYSDEARVTKGTRFGDRLYTTRGISTLEQANENLCARTRA